MYRALKLIFVLLLFVVASFGQTDDIIFSQSYEYSAVDGGTYYESVADDFTPAFTGTVETIVLYQYFDTAQPTSIYLEITEDTGDNNPNTASRIFANSVNVSSYTATGDSVNGMEIFEITCILSQIASVQTGKLYWLEVGLVYNSFALYQEPVVFGSQMWYFQGGQYHTFEDSWDSFFDLLAPVALERNSWASIKNSFN